MTTKTIDLLKQFIRFLERLSEEDWTNLASGKKTMQIKLVEYSHKGQEDEDISEFKELIESLEETNSRQEAEDLIKDIKKNNLIRLLKALDLPVYSNERISRLREKIVEATVGSRLVSQAIQGETSPVSSNKNNLDEL